MNYYDLNASKFIESTLTIDMSLLYDKFTSYLKPGARILDVGCGPGRDVKAFNEMGFDCIGMEPSEELRRFAETYTGKKILSTIAQNISFHNEFDGIWACASLLHAERDELSLVFEKMHTALKSKGVIYVSFKLGNFSGVRTDGRYFVDMTSDLLKNILKNVPGLTFLEEWKTTDLRPENETEWLNVILIKE